MQVQRAGYSRFFAGERERPSKAGGGAKGRPKAAPLGLEAFEVGETLHKFLGAVVGEADGQAAFLVFAIHGDDGAHAVGLVAHADADQRMGSAASATWA